MNFQPQAPPVIAPRHAITYELTRWDLFGNWISILFRNRLIQVFLLVAVIFNGCITLGPGLTSRPLWQTFLQGLMMLFVFAWVLIICQCVLGLASSFLLKHHGVVGQHTLEITEQGLVERTDFNEALHKWPSICRIVSLWGYLYIYVSDTNSHQVPKRCFPPQEMANFEAELRAHVQQFRR
jgi:hypothetical protein